MTILAALYLYAISTTQGREAAVPPVLLAAPFVDIALIVGWLIYII